MKEGVGLLCPTHLAAREGQAAEAQMTTDRAVRAALDDAVRAFPARARSQGLPTVRVGTGGGWKTSRRRGRSGHRLKQDLGTGWSLIAPIGGQVGLGHPGILMTDAGALLFYTGTSWVFGGKESLLLSSGLPVDLDELSPAQRKGLLSALTD